MPSNLTSNFNAPMKETSGNLLEYWGSKKLIPHYLPSVFMLISIKIITLLIMLLFFLQVARLFNSYKVHDLIC